MQQLLALLTKNATIFWENEVFVVLSQQHGNLIYFSAFFSRKVKKSVKIMEKNISFNLGFINKYLFNFYHPYVTMPINVSLNLVYNTTYKAITCIKGFEIFQNKFSST